MRPLVIPGAGGPGDFSKIRDAGGFQITRRVPDGVREVRALIRSGLLSDPRAPIYSNT